jgi:hypothetical protein
VTSASRIQLRHRARTPSSTEWPLAAAADTPAAAGSEGLEVKLETALCAAATATRIFLLPQLKMRRFVEGSTPVTAIDAPAATSLQKREASRVKKKQSMQQFRAFYWIFGQVIEGNMHKRLKTFPKITCKSTRKPKLKYPTRFLFCFLSHHRRH